MENPKFKSLLQQMQKVHDTKNADYAHGGNPYSNFEEAAATAGVTVDQVFAVLMGVKLARLNSLLREHKLPNIESIQDTRQDLAVYAALWASYHEPTPITTSWTPPTGTANYEPAVVVPNGGIYGR